VQHLLDVVAPVAATAQEPVALAPSQDDWMPASTDEVAVAAFLAELAAKRAKEDELAAEQVAAYARRKAAYDAQKAKWLKASQADREGALDLYSAAEWGWDHEADKVRRMSASELLAEYRRRKSSSPAATAPAAKRASSRLAAKAALAGG